MSSFSEAERALMADAAARIVRLRLTVPAAMFLESLAPVNLLTASMLHTLNPVLGIALPPARLEVLASLLERREAIPEFVRELDAAEESWRREKLSKTPSTGAPHA
ncbi:MAG: hypothetical protein ACT4PU_10505 [Planctomycetota bacterium]